MNVSDVTTTPDSGRGRLADHLSTDVAIMNLQREVIRMSGLLNSLALQTPATAARRTTEPPSPFLEDHQIERARREMIDGIGPSDVPTVTATEVRAILQQRRAREQFFDADLFADPAWDMMLDLYVAWLDRKRVSVSSLCIAAAVPATTALRWIRAMEDKGHFVRKPDQHDARRIYVDLSGEALLKLHRYFAQTPKVPRYI